MRIFFICFIQVICFGGQEICLREGTEWKTLEALIYYCCLVPRHSGADTKLGATMAASSRNITSPKILNISSSLIKT